MKRFIVGEASKSWTAEEHHLSAAEGHPPGRFICAIFEDMIEVNWRRGYRLHSWKYNRVMTQRPVAINETIVAVFELHNPPEGS